MQRIWTTINPETTSGIMLAGLLDDLKDSLMTGLAGTSRPAQLQAGGMWIDTTNQAAPNYYWSYKFYDGSEDIEVYRISVLNGIGGTLVADAEFTVKQVGDDAVGALLDLVKNRIATNGQVASGDTVGEIRFVGKTNSDGDPTLAYFRWISTDAQTGSESGGTFSFYSTPDTTSAIEEHFRFIGRLYETVATYKANSIQPVSQNVATAENIAQLSASKMIVEMTGATASNIHGINSTHDSKVVIVHNRSSVNVTFKHSSGTATAADRFKLPKGFDLIIEPEQTATFFYCTSDSRWKLKSTVKGKLTQTITTKYFNVDSWTAPHTGKIKVVSKSYLPNQQTYKKMIDVYGNAYGWGFNFGNIGDGTVTAKSSPVAILGGLRYKHIFGFNYHIGIVADGSAYAWGSNDQGQLGVGNTFDRSSPVAVLGGLKFVKITTSFYGSSVGLTLDGTAYAWGKNTLGQLGVGDVVSRSSPVAVLGGLKFVDVYHVWSQTGNGSYYGLTTNGDIYAWGENDHGQLGDGTVIHKSSPVAVLGGGGWAALPKNPGQSGVTPAMVALKADGTAYAWGNNDSGNLGVGDLIPRSSPVAVLGGLSFTQVWQSSASYTTCYGITSDGTLYAWGNNDFGQLGTGDTPFVQRSSPVAVLGGLKFKRMDANAGTPFAFTHDNNMYSWGASGGFGAHGLNSQLDFSSPVAVMAGTKFYQAVSDSSTSILFTPDGRVYTVGINQNGELGDGTVVSKSSPVLILGPNGQMPKEDYREVLMDVVAGVSYPIKLGYGPSKFGKESLGVGVETITISYTTVGG